VLLAIRATVLDTDIGKNIKNGLDHPQSFERTKIVGMPKFWRRISMLLAALPWPAILPQEACAT
jgi:hypothetical protein